MRSLFHSAKTWLFIGVAGVAGVLAAERAEVIPSWSETSAMLFQAPAPPTNVVVNAPPPGGGSTIPALNCTVLQVQNAIDKASTGDTVTVPAGTCPWATPVTIPNTKGITLQGAGIGNTIIQNRYATDAVLVINVQNGFFTRITGFTFNLEGIEKGTSNNPSTVVNASGSGGYNNFRIDHNRYSNVRDRGIRVNFGGQALGGLIDHNWFDLPFSANGQAIAVFGGGPGTHTQMAYPYEPGTNKFIFIEDNIFDYNYQNDGVVEGYGGGRFVSRFNTIHGGTQGNHGADSGNYRGTHSFETYFNTLDRVGYVGTNTNPRSITTRGGTGFIYGNRISSDYGSMDIRLYRETDDVGTLNQCDGNQPWDGNVGPPAGWPCIDQAGWVFTDVLDGTRSWHPLYYFLNTKGGSQVNGVSSVGHIVANRDYYNQNASCVSGGACTAGVGIGTSLPTTCTTGVGFWDTDAGSWNTSSSNPEGVDIKGADGTFSRCTATNTWTLYYTPYTYPHPLQGS